VLACLELKSKEEEERGGGGGVGGGYEVRRSAGNNLNSPLLSLSHSLSSLHRGSWDEGNERFSVSQESEIPVPRPE
jgi:hypothetical protein